MGIWDKVRSFTGLDALETRGVTLNTPTVSLSRASDFWNWMNADGHTVSGEQINEGIALQLTTVMACVRVLSESVASLPCVLYERTKNGREEAFDNPLHYILGTEPNSDMSAFQFWESVVGGCALTGNAYAEIKWTPDNSVGELYPLDPLKTEPVRLLDGTLAYKTRQGMESGKHRIILPENCLHFACFSLDGLHGISPISMNRELLGLSRAAAKYASRYFGNGASPGGILTISDSEGEQLDERMLALAKSSWEAAHGAGNQGKVAVLPGNWTYTPTSLDPDKSQLKDVREFLRTEIAACFRVPPNMIGDTQRLSNSNHEQQSLEFVTSTIRPILSRIEAELNRKLMPVLGRKANKFFARFDLTERLRADTAATATMIQVGRQNGILSVDESRLALGMNPLGGQVGTSLMFPVNMTNSSKFLAEDEPEPAEKVKGASGDDDSQTVDDETVDSPLNTPSPDKK